GERTGDRARGASDGAAARRHPPFRPHRHEGGLRRRGVRRLRCPHRRRAGEQLPHAAGARRGDGDRDDRRHRHRRGDAHDPGVLPRMRRRAVRHLHAGHGAGGDGAAGAQYRADRRGRPRRAGRQPVPLHRLHADLRVGPRRLPQAAVDSPAMMPLLDGYQLVTPASLSEALDDLATNPGARPFAGGTDLMVLLEAGHLPPGRYVDLQHCHELLGIEYGAEGVAIGAMTSYTEIRNSPELATDYPLLGMAAAETGGVATQNRGTIGGNIANASPAADTPPALIVYDAELEIVSSRGTRRVPYDRFHTGYKKMDLGA